MSHLLLELDKCENLIKECESKIATLRISIAAVDKDLNSYEYVERDMEDNLKILKQDKIIVLVTEFKELKESMNKIRRKIELLKLDKVVYEANLSRVELFLKNILIKKQAIEEDLNRDNLVIFKLRSKL